MQDTKSFRLLRIAREVLAKRSISADEDEAESGFTLIELMVVLLIMAILLAIAIPTFLGVKGGANDRAAQSDLTNAAISGKATYVNAQTFGSTTAYYTTIKSQEPELTFTDTGASTLPTNGSGPGSISVQTYANGQILVMSVLSQNTTAGNQNCFWVEDNESGAADTLDGAPQGVNYGFTAGGTCQPAATTEANAPSTAANWSSGYPTTVASSHL
jgi:type IV pilus assembly protein PilA